MSRVKSVSTRPQLNNIFHDTVPLRSLYLFCKKWYLLRNRLLSLLSLQKFVVDIVIFRDVDHSLIAIVILTTTCIMNRWSSRFSKECFIIMNIEPSKCFSLQGIKIWHFLTLWRRQTKSSPIFAKLLQLVPRGTLSSELFEFLRYLYPFQRYAKFSFFGFFLTVHAVLNRYLNENYTV